MVESLKEFMPQMGTGPKSSEDLTYDQASEAMEIILGKEVEPVSFGGFTVAERWKSQTPEELAGFLDVIRSGELVTIDPDRDFYVDVAGRFDGKAKSVNTDLAGSLLAVASGVPVFTHSAQNIPTQEAATIIDVLASMGWNNNPDPGESARALDEFGFSYSHQKTYAPELESVRSLRREVGVRTFINTVESMVNPSNARIHVGAFYHLPFANRVCKTFNRSESQDLDRVVMLQGIEGQPEFRPGTSVLAEWHQGKLDDLEVKTADYDLDYNRDQLNELGADPSVSADLTRQLLLGESVPEAFTQSALLNAALKVYAGKNDASLKESVNEVRAVHKTDKPRSLFENLEDFFG